MAQIPDLTALTTLDDADLLVARDTSAAVDKKITWSNAKATLGINAVNGRVGVNTTDPTLSGTEAYSRLTVLANDDVAVTNSVAANSGIGQTGIILRRYGGTTARWYMYIPASSADLRLFNGADRVSFKANGDADFAGTIQADGLRLDVTPTSETIVCTHTITININGTDYKVPCRAA